jgi:selenocysteine lyase/cysteine desulfurase
MATTTFDVEAARAHFSALRRGFTFLDAPGGTQVPDEVGEAIARALRDASGNLGAPYPTGRAVEAILDGAKSDAARFLGCSPAEVVFGMNMTTLNFALTRTAGRDFAPGDEILTTELDHDGGVAPWLELAADRGLTVRIAAAADDLTVDYDDLERKLGDRTRVVAFALASNATGSIADAKRISRLAREAGALSWIDAVHYAPHEPIDVREIGCDVLLCSPYKFCGPHLGIAYTRAETAEAWRPY